MAEQSRRVQAAMGPAGLPPSVPLQPRPSTAWNLHISAQGSQAAGTDGGGGGAVLGPRVGSGLWLACCHLTPRNGLSTCTQQRVQLPVRPARCLLPLGRCGHAVPRPGTRVPPRLKTASGRDAAADLGRQGRDVLRWNDGQRRWRE